MKFIIKPYASVLCLLSLASVASWCADSKISVDSRSNACELALNAFKKKPKKPKSEHQASKEDLVLAELLRYFPKDLGGIILDYADLRSYYVLIPTYSKKDNRLIFKCFDGYSVLPREITLDLPSSFSGHHLTNFKHLGDSIFAFNSGKNASKEIWIGNINTRKYTKLAITQHSSKNVINNMVLYNGKILTLTLNELAFHDPDTGEAIPDKTVSTKNWDIDSIISVQIAQCNPSWLIFMSLNNNNHHGYENNLTYYDIESKKTLFRGKIRLWGNSFTQRDDGTIAAQKYKELGIDEESRRGEILIMRINPITQEETTIDNYILPNNSTNSILYSNRDIMQHPPTSDSVVIAPLKDLQRSSADQLTTELQQVLEPSKITKLKSPRKMVIIPKTNKILFVYEGGDAISLGSITPGKKRLRLAIQTLPPATIVKGTGYEAPVFIVAQKELLPTIKRQEKEKQAKQQEKQNQVSRTSGSSNLLLEKYWHDPASTGAI